MKFLLQSFKWIVVVGISLALVFLAVNPVVLFLNHQLFIKGHNVYDYQMEYYGKTNFVLTVTNK